MNEKDAELKRRAEDIEVCLNRTVESMQQACDELRCKCERTINSYIELAKHETLIVTKEPSGKYRVTIPTR